LPNASDFSDFLVKLNNKGIKVKLSKIEAYNNMTDESWDAYRQEQWTKKGNVYKGDVPDWFLNKNDTLNFMEKREH
jgi:hypothetical protein